MSYWQWRQQIESQFPWWTPFAAIGVVFIVYLIVYFIKQKLGNK